MLGVEKIYWRRERCCVDDAFSPSHISFLFTICFNEARQNGLQGIMQESKARARTNKSEREKWSTSEGHTFIYGAVQWNIFLAFRKRKKRLLISDREEFNRIFSPTLLVRRAKRGAREGWESSRTTHFTLIKNSPMDQHTDGEERKKKLQNETKEEKKKWEINHTTNTSASSKRVAFWCIAKS